MNEHEQRLIASISKSMAVMCVRNTTLEDIHAGIEPVSHTLDFSDVVVIDADGRRLPWPEVSRIGNNEMGNLMRQVVNRLYTFQAKARPSLRGDDGPRVGRSLEMGRGGAR